MTPRITTDFWVSAFRARMDRMHIPLYIRAKGDPTAGAVILKIDSLDGAAQAYTRTHDLDGNEEWVPLADGPEPEVNAVLDRQQANDPDLWIIEVEDRTGRALFTDDPLPR